MNDTTSTPPEVVATFRYSVIAPLVVRPLMFGEQRALVAEQAVKIWQWPDGVNRPVHARTLLRWVAAYRTGGLEALQPQPRPPHPLRRVSAAVLDLLALMLIVISSNNPTATKVDRAVAHGSL